MLSINTPETVLIEDARLVEEEQILIQGPRFGFHQETWGLAGV